MFWRQWRLRLLKKGMERALEAELIEVLMVDSVDLFATLAFYGTELECLARFRPITFFFFFGWGVGISRVSSDPLTNL